MRYMALDLGEKRVGIAISDATGTIAEPLAVLPAAEVLGMATPFRRLLQDYEPEMLVCGLPKTMSGDAGPQAARIQEAARALALSCGLPLEFQDERLSSAEAKRILRAQGLNEKKMRGKVDMVAASLFLQAFLDGRAAERPIERPEER